MINWQPTSSLATMQLRAEIYAQIRHFFAERQVLEVDTPILSHAAVTDVHLASVMALYQEIGAKNTESCYLQTSPEYHMKRLLAAGSPSIYQICKVFRNGEIGRKHNPEFTLLEWYKLGWNEHQLMDEIDALIQLILATKTAERCSYEAVFFKYVALNPHTASLSDLKQCALKNNIHLVNESEAQDRDLWLQLIMAEVIEPQIGKTLPIFIYDFPASQAALARINPTNPAVASRFELYFQGIELANGFYELANAAEQATRFNADLSKRQEMDLPLVPRDERLLAALEQGLPECAGVALGLDRLIMIAAKAAHIEQVISFPFTIA